MINLFEDNRFSPLPRRKELIKRSFVLFFILSILFFFLYQYYLKQGFFDSFKLAHIKDTYIPSLSYGLKGKVNDFRTSGLAALTADSSMSESNVATVNSGFAKSIPILLYHGAIEDPDGHNTLLANFREQMFTLKEAGWQTVSIDDFYLFLQGKKNLPDRSFLLTFDDGRKDSYYPVDPILKALGYRAVMFVITKYSLNDDDHNKFYLWENELKEMLKTGRWDIQPHAHEGHDLYKIARDDTFGHFYSNKLWLEDKSRLETDREFTQRIAMDFLLAKTITEDTLGIDAISFAYPFGDFGQTTINFSRSQTLIKNAIDPLYPISFYQVWPRKGFSFNYPNENESLIKRIDVRSYWSPDNLLKMMETAQEKELPYFDSFSNYNGWLKTSGKLAIENNSMILGSRFSDDSSVFLEGSYLWKNYIFQSNVTLSKGQTFSVTARYKDEENYVSCEFTPNYTRIQRMINGKQDLAEDAENTSIRVGETHRIAIKVQDNVATCYIDNKSIVSGYISNARHYGGVGFKTWDPIEDNSEIIIKQVSVREL